MHVDCWRLSHLVYPERQLQALETLLIHDNFVQTSDSPLCRFMQFIIPRNSLEFLQDNFWINIASKLVLNSSPTATLLKYWIASQNIPRYSHVNIYDQCCCTSWYYASTKQRKMFMPAVKNNILVLSRVQAANFEDTLLIHNMITLYKPYPLHYM